MKYNEVWLINYDKIAPTGWTHRLPLSGIFRAATVMFYTRYLVQSDHIYNLYHLLDYLIQLYYSIISNKELINCESGLI